MRYTRCKYSQGRKFQDFFKEEVKQNTSNFFLFTRKNVFTKQCCKDNFQMKFFFISYLAHSTNLNNCSFTNFIQRLIVLKARYSASMALEVASSDSVFDGLFHCATLQKYRQKITVKMFLTQTTKVAIQVSSKTARNSLMS